MEKRKIFNREVFIEKAKEIYGDKFDYSSIGNVSSKTEKVPVKCPEHGVFYTNYNRFICENSGCPKCNIKKPHKWTQESVIEKIHEIHGDRYDTSKVVYRNIKEKITLVCPEHGEFQIDFGHILRHQGCPKCRYVKSGKGTARTLDEVIEQSKKVHGDKYAYDLITEYKNDRIKYPIICPEHGVFYQTFNNHIKGKQGCPICGRMTCDEKRKITFDEFAERARKVHGDRYEYVEDGYNGVSDYVTIICSEHGVFKQTGTNHLNGQGCPVCKYVDCGLKQRLSKEEFIERARKVHGDRYDYTKMEYTGLSTKSCITCPKHGDFWQLPYNHLLGNGCPKCVPLHSQAEEKIYKFIKEELGISDAISRDRVILEGKELDILIPSEKIAIEYDGLFWHNEKTVEKKFHLEKTLKCEKNGIRLIHVFEDEWLHKQDIVKSMLKNALNKTPNKIYARKCVIGEAETSEALKFLEENHIQGKCHSKIKIGLYYEGELVSLMCFGQTRHFIGNKSRQEWELLRFCNKLNNNVIGGASKIFKHFIDAYKPETIVSYADRRWSRGKLYEVLGFEKYNESRPNYYYVIGDKRFYRFNFRKSLLVQKYGCPPEMSEHDFCLSKKWYRIYDCGCLCYRWKK